MCPAGALPSAVLSLAALASQLLCREGTSSASRRVLRGHWGRDSPEVQGWPWKHRAKVLSWQREGFLHQAASKSALDPKLPSGRCRSHGNEDQVQGQPAWLHSSSEQAAPSSISPHTQNSTRQSLSSPREEDFRAAHKPCTRVLMSSRCSDCPLSPVGRPGGHSLLRQHFTDGI